MIYTSGDISWARYIELLKKRSLFCLFCCLLFCVFCVFCAVLFFTGHFVMAHLNLTLWTSTINGVTCFHKRQQLRVVPSEGFISKWWTPTPGGV